MSYPLAPALVKPRQVTFKVLTGWRCYARVREPRTGVPVLPQLGRVFQAEPCGSSPLAAVKTIFRYLPLLKNLVARMMNHAITYSFALTLT